MNKLINNNKLKKKFYLKYTMYEFDVNVLKSLMLKFNYAVEWLLIFSSTFNILYYNILYIV